MCDVESYIYLPLLEELGYVPTEKYARAPEILAHSRAIGRHFDLYRRACFQTEVTELRWDEAGAHWIVATNRGDRMKARFVCMANGPLNRPKLPGIPGIESFAGHSFHTSRWDYGYTGGDSNGNLTGLRGKRVGIIGTGATAVQCVPHLGAAAEQLYVFQRTPSSIDVRGNRPTDPTGRSIEQGWHQQRMDNFNILVSGGFQAEDLVNDGWTDIIRKLLVMVQDDQDGAVARDGIAKTLEMADFQKMEQIRARVDAIVGDPGPPRRSSPTIASSANVRASTTSISTPSTARTSRWSTPKAGASSASRPPASWVAGVEYPVDCLIYATGFEVGTDYSRRAGYEITGRDGVTLTRRGPAASARCTACTAAASRTASSWDRSSRLHRATSRTC
jgi:cyclohexanone monooxygenase